MAPALPDLSALEYRRPVSLGDNPLLLWIFFEGEEVRLVGYLDFSPVRDGRPPREFVVRLSHRRWRCGVHYCDGLHTEATARWMAGLPADTWMEIPDGMGGPTVAAGKLDVEVGL